MIDLGPFCSTPADKYLVAKKPFSRAGYTWATNGYIMLRVPLRPDVIGNPKAPKAELLWKQRDGAFRPVVPFEIGPNSGPQCKECGGTGRKHDCPQCGCQCPECEGRGFTIEAAVAVSVGPVCIQRKYAALMMTLPALEIQMPDRGDIAVHFRFDGGEGILMVYVTSPECVVADIFQRDEP